MANPATTNPYVGPEPFQRDQAHLFFGRQREAIRLRSLVESSQGVLFFAPSGAGKTSLIQARLIPELEADGFTALRCRVGGENAFPRIGGNPYVLTALSYLAEQNRGIHRAVEMGNVSLSQHLTTGRFGEDPVVLIIDQFEEILTTPTRRPEDREDFFLQMREALRGHPNLTVLLVMREDHLAALEPYAPLLPDRLRARYRMDRLTGDQALDAIRQPARHAGRPFAHGIAEALLGALRRERREAATSGAPGETAGPGEATFSHGEFIEPVQLQVVCYQLWESLTPSGGEITHRDLDRFGPIEAALGAFYDKVVARVAAGVGMAERRIRSWFGTRLITPDRFRSLLKRGQGHSGDLPNTVVDALVREHLVRAEPRVGSLWYELVHDSFVQPILTSNEHFFDAVAPLRAAARAWREAGRAPAFLPTGPALLRQQQCARENPALVSTEDEEYLRTAWRRRHQRRLFRAALATGLAVFLGLTLFTFLKTREAEQEQRRGRVIALAWSAETALRTDPRKSLESALQAAALAGTDPASTRTAREALRQAIEAPLSAPDHHWTTDEDIVALAMDATGDRVATLEWDGQVTLWQVAASRVLLRHPLRDPFALLALSPDGERLAIALESGGVQQLRLGAEAPEALCGEAGDAFTALTFSPDGARLALGSARGEVVLCDLATAKTIRRSSTSRQSLVLDLAFSATGEELFWGDEDGGLNRWRIGSGAPIANHRGHVDPVVSLAVSPDDRVLTSTGEDGVVKSWDLPSLRFMQAITGDIGASTGAGREALGIDDLAYFADGQLVAASRRGEVMLWNPATSVLSLLPLPHLRQSARPVFSGNGERCGIVEGKTLRLWRLLPGGTVDGRDLPTLRGIARQRLEASAPPEDLQDPDEGEG